MASDSEKGIKRIMSIYVMLSVEKLLKSQGEIGSLLISGNDGRKFNRIIPTAEDES